MLAHLCFVLAAGDGLDEAEAARACPAAVEPDDRAVDVFALVWVALVWVPVVAAPAAVRPRARPPATTPAAMAVPTSGRKILTQFSLACGSHPRLLQAAGRAGWPAATSRPGESGADLGVTYHDMLNWPAVDLPAPHR
jgi:hypothetical protein